MSKFINFRMAFTLVSIGLMFFSLALNFSTYAQDKDACEDTGWTDIDASEVDLAGNWAGNQNRNCKESAAWQYNFSVKITEPDKGNYQGWILTEDPMVIDIDGSGIVFSRDVTKSSGRDEKQVYTQTWTGKIQKNKDGRIRIYGTWTGAYQQRKIEGYNLDFVLMKL
jgi:hypothetical protein